MNPLKRIIGSRNHRLLAGYEKIARRINALEPELGQASDINLGERASVLRRRAGEGEALDDLLPEAFALVREASVRTLGMRHFDVQLMGGIALHQGKIAEMRTGEGKTLVATLPAFLNSLSGGSVHIVTVNDYLAQRDADWMGPVYRFLGCKVGVVQSQQSAQDKCEAYLSDVCYGTNNEFGFDYLRDNLALRAEDQAQRGLAFAIVDEVDSILIDEARTPLIISGPAEESTDLYRRMDQVAPRLCKQEQEDAPGDFTLDEKARQAYLTDEGHEHVERLLAQAGLIQAGASLYDASNVRLMHHMTAALRARYLFKRDVDYIVRDGEVVIVDEFTGRTMPGRRWSDGLHQAVEAKEKVAVRKENRTVASITFQNYFRMYEKLAGMTGTADTEAYEFQQIYGLEVVVVPTHEKMIRNDEPDLVFLTSADKFNAVAEDIKESRERGQPVLVGTASIETSELLSGKLRELRIPHQVLNAKQHAREAQIIAEAGRPGVVTIATNMAGRGTDIVLGGNLEAEMKALGEDAPQTEKDALGEDWKQRNRQVLEAGGLRIVGTERHESRRIDNQLRGRSGRQGDPGASRFYISLEDSLMRIFGDPKRTQGMLSSVGMREGEAIESKLLTRQIERAQRKVEAHNFDVRKQLLEYDDVANDQRRVVYEQRNELLGSGDVSEIVENMRRETVLELVNQHMPEDAADQDWDPAALEKALNLELGAQAPVAEWLEASNEMDSQAVAGRIIEELGLRYRTKTAAVEPQAMRHIERVVLLQQLDHHWKEHLAAMDYLRQGIHLRGYAQRNPKQEYKREAFEMFTEMLGMVARQVTVMLSRAQFSEAATPSEPPAAPQRALRLQHEAASALSASDLAANPKPSSTGAGKARRTQRAPAPSPVQTYRRASPRIGRNDPCPCGSGKKYKRCCGAAGAGSGPAAQL
ncbi:MAG: preprotein translocase subunit SecA [Gammaproteobacteria bacterium]|nr:preprotein translocase subunit SecA [Gammaproteobacteria bacterium]MCY4255926.1 preprotein translocase subunit SecA [Gammaproteobacteria bacterium]